MTIVIACIQRSSDVPLEEDRHNPSSVDADLLPSGLGHVEVLQWRIAPSPIVAREGKVRRAEVGRSDGHGDSFNAPPWVRVVVAHDLVALPTGCSVVEQRSA